MELRPDFTKIKVLLVMQCACHLGRFPACNPHYGSIKCRLVKGSRAETTGHQFSERFFGDLSKKRKAPEEDDDIIHNAAVKAMRSLEDCKKRETVAAHGP
ncbi:hypothetical protein HKX48_007213 [Thoreauomyces humboldtii]|nr:hypothetical protein HKX48_007213 [Thoreauomyces humboldtii]